jgi:hypothetical protein
MRLLMSSLISDGLIVVAIARIPLSHIAAVTHAEMGF